MNMSTPPDQSNLLTDFTVGPHYIHSAKTCNTLRFRLASPNVCSSKALSRVTRLSLAFQDAMRLGSSR